MSIESRIQNDVSLAPLTTFKIGGPAKFFVEAETPEELVAAIAWAREKGEKYFILGGGSNLLVSDKGFDGLIIKNNCREIRAEANRIYANTGAPLSQLVQIAAENNLAGLEWATGIPGTVGGAVRGNAGAFGSSMQSIVESAQAFDPEKHETLNLNFDQCKFAYRHSIFKENGLIVLSATIKLAAAKPEAISEASAKYVKYRADGQPKEPSAGSIFKNVLTTDLKMANPEAAAEAEKEGIVRGGKISAGWLISRLGFKGKTIGGAQVSLEHANFIVNKGGATAGDVLMLMSLIKQKVRVEYGVQLQTEIQYLDY